MKTESQRVIKPTCLKNILVEAEDKRIASMLSEISYQVLDKQQIDKRSEQIRRVHLNLESGQQCVRDFFFCIQENLENWPDVYSHFSFTLQHSVRCSQCQSVSEYETNQCFLEILLTSNNSKLQTIVEKEMNEESSIEAFCPAGCNSVVRKMKKTQLVDGDEAKFLIVVLSRGVQISGGFELSSTKIDILDSINFRYIILMNIR